MNIIEIDAFDSEVFHTLQKAIGDNENIDIIQGKNFSGNISNIEIYAPLVVSVISAITPIVLSLISKHRISSIKIDGDKLDITNVSEAIAKKVVEGFFEKHKISEEETIQGNMNNTSLNCINTVATTTENENTNEKSDTDNNTDMEQNELK